MPHDLLGILETIKIKFVADATGHEGDGTALSAAIKSLPSQVSDVLFRHDNQKHKRKVFFNEAVEVRFYKFSVWERTWRRIVPGSTKKVWTDLQARYAERFRSQGKAYAATPKVDQKLRMIPGRWLGDTGASWHMCAPDDIHPSLLRRKGIPTDREIWLDTANGPIKANRKVHIGHPKLPMDIDPLLLDNSPPVMSVGKFCMEEGYGFYWLPGEPPFLLSPTGEKLVFEVQNNVPYLNLDAESTGEFAIDDTKCRPCGPDLSNFGQATPGVVRTHLSADKWERRELPNGEYEYTIRHPKTRVYRTVDPLSESGAPRWSDVDRVLTYDYKSGKKLREITTAHTPYPD